MKRAAAAALVVGLVVSALVFMGLTAPRGSADPLALETARCDGTYNGLSTGVDSGVTALQPFTASVAGPPDSVDIHVGKVGNMPDTDALRVSIRAFDDATGQPGDVFATSSLPATAFSDDVEGVPAPVATVQFAAATALKAGGRYSLEFASDTTQGSFTVQRVAQGACSRAQAARSGAPSLPLNAPDAYPFVARVGLLPKPPANPAPPACPKPAKSHHDKDDKSKHDEHHSDGNKGTGDKKDHDGKSGGHKPAKPGQCR